MDRLLAPGEEFEDLVTLLLNNYQMVSNRSVPRVQRALKYLRRAFGTARAVDIKPHHLTAYASERIEEGAALATVAYELAVLKRAMNLAVRDELLPYRPKFAVISPSNARQGFFEEPDFQALHGELPEDLRPVVAFAYATGWRIQSEVLSLRWAQVDLAAGTVRLEPGTTKNGEGRPFPALALPELHACWSPSGSGPARPSGGWARSSPGSFTGTASRSATSTTPGGPPASGPGWWA